MESMLSRQNRCRSAAPGFRNKCVSFLPEKVFFQRQLKECKEFKLLMQELEKEKSGAGRQRCGVRKKALGKYGQRERDENRRNSSRKRQEGDKKEGYEQTRRKTGRGREEKLLKIQKQGQAKDVS
jgi:hypothetical protein